MFHHHSARYPFAVSDNLIVLPPRFTLRANLEGSGNIGVGSPAPSVQESIINVTAQPYTFGAQGTYVFNRPAGFAISLPNPPPAGRWTFIRGVLQVGLIQIDATNELNGVIFQDSQVLGSATMGTTTGIRFLSGGLAGDTLTITSDGNSYYFRGASAGQGFELNLVGG